MKGGQARGLLKIMVKNTDHVFDLLVFVVSLLSFLLVAGLYLRQFTQYEVIEFIDHLVYRPFEPLPLLTLLIALVVLAEVFRALALLFTPQGKKEWTEALRVVIAAAIGLVFTRHLGFFITYLLCLIVLEWGLAGKQAPRQTREGS